MYLKPAHTLLATGLMVACAHTKAHEISFDKVCDLVARTDTTLEVRVLQSYDLCRSKKWDCYGMVHTVVPIATQMTKPIEVITSAQLGTGDTYTLLLSSLDKTRDVFLYNLRYETYRAPDGIKYFLGMNAAFQTNGTQHFREMPRFCHGEAPDCVSLRNQVGANKELLSAKVVYPGFAKELASCPR